MSKTPTLDELISSLEPQEKTAEAQLTQQITAPAEQTQGSENTELRKIAEEVDMQARAFARSFADELQKIAVGVSELTPNTAAVPANPAVQVSTEEAHEADTAKVEAIIKKLTMGGEAKVNPAGYIAVNGQPVESTQPIAQDEHPVAADVKQADADVLNALYAKYFVA
jgi:hypothetical protein